MNIIELKEADMYQGNLICVNAQHAYREPPGTNRLTSVGSAKCSVQMHHRAASILLQVLADLCCNPQIIPISGHRSREEQEHLYQDSLYKNGTAFTEKYVAWPGHSEHQTGLAVDMALNNDTDIDFIRPAFPYTGVCKAFRERALLYGFIERYPRGKERLTGIGHEPWHFRYVGFPHSVLMRQLDLTLEEYVAFVRAFPYRKYALTYRAGGQSVEIAYVPAEADTQVLEMADDLPHQISGDNAEGYIITIWGKRA